MESILTYFDEFNEIQMKQLLGLQSLYMDWNEKINVISRKDMDNFYKHHVLHSLAIATEFEFSAGMQIMDLGCGGGFPGLPLAIFYPEVQFHMVDSINKKLKVVQEIAHSLEIKNITTQHSRAEDIRDKKFDAVVSRAVAPLKSLWQWSKPLLKKSNHYQGLICLKGGDLTQEIFESQCKPAIWEIEKIFPDSFFKDKYLLQVK